MIKKKSAAAKGEIVKTKNAKKKLTDKIFSAKKIISIIYTNKYNHFLYRILSEFVQISTKHDTLKSQP